MNRNYIKICFKLLNYWFKNLLNSTNFKSIFINKIVLSDSKKSIYSVEVSIVLLNNYSFIIYLDFIEERFSLKAFDDVDFRCYKIITGNLGGFK